MFSGGIPIGRPFGIPVKLHWSWFLILFLITWILATDFFPSIEEYESWSTATRWILGLVTGIIFFLSVLAHELAHSLVAKADGLRVGAITLFFFGGVSQLSEEPKSPGGEFRMAMAGPGISLLVAGVCWGIFFATRNHVSAATGMAFWLAAMNSVLAGFNLIPGFPLDGGRVLRSILWWRSHNLRRATKIASIIGRAFGFIFIFGGIGLIFTPWLATGVSLLFIGWLLESAAGASYRQVALQAVLQGHKVFEVMTRDCLEVPSTLTLEQLVNDYILKSGRRCYSVVDWGRSVGLVTDIDVRAVEKRLWPERTVRQVMTPIDRMRQVRPDDDLSSVLHLLTEENVRQTPVVVGSNITGVVSRDSLLSFIHLHSKFGV